MVSHWRSKEMACWALGSEGKQAAGSMGAVLAMQLGIKLIPVILQGIKGNLFGLNTVALYKEEVWVTSGFPCRWDINVIIELDVSLPSDKLPVKDLAESFFRSHRSNFQIAQHFFHLLQDSSSPESLIFEILQVTCNKEVHLVHEDGQQCKRSMEVGWCYFVNLMHSRPGLFTVDNLSAVMNYTAMAQQSKAVGIREPAQREPFMLAG